MNVPIVGNSERIRKGREYLLLKTVSHDPAIVWTKESNIRIFAMWIQPVTNYCLLQPQRKPRDMLINLQKQLKWCLGIVSKMLCIPNIAQELMHVVFFFQELVRSIAPWLQVGRIEVNLMSTEIAPSEDRGGSE